METTYTLSTVTPQQISGRRPRIAILRAREERQKIFHDQQRLRENMKRLTGSAEEKALIQRYTQQLNPQESRPEAIDKDIQQIEAKKDAAQAVLDRTIQDLSFDKAI